MNRLISKLLAVLFLISSNALAEQTSVPYTFQPGTPAKAGEVNANFSSLVQVLEGIKSLHLYQNNMHKGKSVLLNVMKLDSGYLAAPFTESGNSNVYLLKNKADMLYQSTDCTGAAYLKKPVNKVDIHTGELGYLFALNDMPDAYTSGLANTGQTVTLKSEKIAESRFECLQVAPYTCTQYPPGSCRPLTVPMQLTVYPIAINNPAATGVTTTSCVRDGSPAICLPNAQLVRE
jgi:hypothetical protein